MSDGQHEEQLRRLGTAVIPVTPQEVVDGRRDRMVGAIGRSIRDSVSRRERGVRLRRVCAAATVAACLGLGLFGLSKVRGPEPSAAEARTEMALRVRSASGTSAVSRSGKSVAVSAGSELRRGEVLKTALLSRVELETDKSQLVLYPVSELVLSEASASEERILLRLGRVDVSVDKATHPERSVVVETPDADIVVRGTLFDVQVEPETEQAGTVTNVGVTRGTVQILQRGALVVSLRAGERWSSRRRSAPSAMLESVAESPAATAPNPSPAAKPEPSAVALQSGTLADENRLFQEALDARGRNDLARAVELFGRLVARYPRSPLVEEARVERFRGLRRLGQDVRAAAEARRYLAQHPGGFAAAEARQLALEPVAPATRE